MKKKLLFKVFNYEVSVELWLRLFKYYMCLETTFWAALFYISFSCRDLFDHRSTSIQQFVQNIDTYLYFEVVFGNLDLYYLDTKEQQIIRGKVK